MRLALAMLAAGMLGFIAGWERASGNSSDLGCGGGRKLATAAGLTSWQVWLPQLWPQASSVEHGSGQGGQGPKWHLHIIQDFESLA